VDAAIKRSIGVERAAMPVVLKHPDRLSAFIRAHPDITQVIRGAIERLPAYFPADSVEVAVESDPDEDGEPEAVVTVRTRRPASEAMAALDRFDRDWLLPTIRERLPARLPVLVTVRQA
jgi:hypothetical protein